MRLGALLACLLVEFGVGSDNVPFACHPHCGDDVRDLSVEWWVTPAVYDLPDAHAAVTRRIAVASNERLDGGGKHMGPRIAQYVAHRLGMGIPRCVEVCAGPGYIGFLLLASGLCETMVFVEVNPWAIEFLRMTVEQNGLEDVVDIFHADVLDGVPESEYGRWSLVVSNPPHFLADEHHNISFFDELDPSRTKATTGLDHDWNLHRRFYASVGKFLVQHQGHVVFGENMIGSQPKDFLPMLDSSDLQIYQLAPDPSRGIWFMHSINFRIWYANALDNRDESCRWVVVAAGRGTYTLHTDPKGCSLLHSTRTCALTRECNVPGKCLEHGCI